MSELAPRIVLDIGSQNVRAGLSGDDAPISTFPSMIGRPKYLLSMVGMGMRDSYVGDEAQHKRGIYALKHPVEHGIVHDWDDWERLVHHTIFNELRVVPEEHELLFTVPILNPHANEVRATELYFETFGIPSLCGAYSPVLSLYASGRVSGVVCQIGAGLTQIVPIYCGHLMHNAIYRSSIAGNTMTSYLASMMTERSNAFTNPTSGVLHSDIERVKCEISYTAADYDEELAKYASQNPNSSDPRLPSSEGSSSSKSLLRNCTFDDGMVHTFGSERVRCGELLFKPKLMGFETPGLHHLVYKSILQCPMDTRRDFYNEIVPVGGVPNLPGFRTRLFKEISALAPSSLARHVRVIQCDSSENLAWVGGSIFSSLNYNPPKFFSKQEYDEIGPKGIFRHGGLTIDPSLIP